MSVYRVLVVEYTSGATRVVARGSAVQLADKMDELVRDPNVVAAWVK